MATGGGEGKLWIQTCLTPQKLALCRIQLEQRGWWTHTHIFIWNGDALSVTVIIERYEIGKPCSNLDETVFHFALMPFGKPLIHLFSFHLWINSRARTGTTSICNPVEYYISLYGLNSSQVIFISVSLSPNKNTANQREKHSLKRIRKRKKEKEKKTILIFQLQNIFSYLSVISLSIFLFLFLFFFC